MKKLLVIVGFVISGLLVNNAKAQISIGATLGSNFFAGEAKFGFNLFGKYEFKEKMLAGLNIGYTGMGSSEITTPFYTESFSSSLLPITGLFEYHFGGEKIKPYVGGDLGFYSFKATLKINSIITSSSSTYLGLAPTAGAFYEINDKFLLCANFKYNIILSSAIGTFGGLNFGAVYKLK